MKQKEEFKLLTVCFVWLPGNFANKYPVTYFQRPLADNYIWLIYILSVYNPN